MKMGSTRRCMDVFRSNVEDLILASDFGTSILSNNDDLKEVVTKDFL